MQNLRGLWIKWAQLNDFSIIRNLKSLNYLIIGGSSSITSLRGLDNLNNMKSLELNKFFGLKNLSELAGLKRLERLELYGSIDGKILQIDDIGAISNLKNLKKLVLDIKSQGIDINPIFGLNNLETLILPGSYFKNMTKKEILTFFPKLIKGLID